LKIIWECVGIRTQAHELCAPFHADGRAGVEPAKAHLWGCAGHYTTPFPK